MPAGPKGYSVGTQWVLNGYSMGTQWVLNGYSKGTQRVLSGYSVGTQWVLNGYSMGTRWVLSGTHSDQQCLLCEAMWSVHSSLAQRCAVASGTANDSREQRRNGNAAAHCL